jgi:hypothetical protein
VYILVLWHEFWCFKEKKLSLLLHVFVYNNSKGTKLEEKEEITCCNSLLCTGIMTLLVHLKLVKDLCFCFG